MIFQQKLSKFCEDCCLNIIKTTFEREDVSAIFRGIGRDLGLRLSPDIIPSDMQERIQQAATDDQALYHFCQVC